MGTIYHCKMSKRESEICETLRKRIAGCAGVTLVGNRLTVRWHEKNATGTPLVSVHMIIECVDTGEDDET